MSLAFDILSCIIAPGLIVFQAPSIRRKINKTFLTIQNDFNISEVGGNNPIHLRQSKRLVWLSVFGVKIWLTLSTLSRITDNGVFQLNKIETQRAMSVAKCQQRIINVEPNSDGCSDSAIHGSSGKNIECKFTNSSYHNSIQSIQIRSLTNSSPWAWWTTYIMFYLSLCPPRLGAPSWHLLDMKCLL